MSKKTLTASFLAISVSFFHPKRLQPVHVLLELNQISHPHTGEMLADKLVSALDRWGIDRSRILMVVTDNGANMVKCVRLAGDELEDESCNDSAAAAAAAVDDDEQEEGGDDDEEYDEEIADSDDIEESFDDTLQLKRFPCIAHTLQLVVKELTKNQSYNNVIAKAKDLVKSLRISSVGQEKLLQLAGKVVIKDCTTRWNATLLMIERLLSIRAEVEAVLKTIKRDSLTNTEWAKLTDIQRLLEPFKHQTNTLRTDTMSLSYVIPSLLELSLHPQDASLPKTFANQLRVISLVPLCYLS